MDDKLQEGRDHCVITLCIPSASRCQPADDTPTSSPSQLHLLPQALQPPAKSFKVPKPHSFPTSAL